MDRYEIDILINNTWKLLRYCSSSDEVITCITTYRKTHNNKIRVLENNVVIQFINDGEYAVEYFKKSEEQRQKRKVKRLEK